MRILFIAYGSESLGIEYLSGVLKKNGHDVTLAFEPGLFADQHYLHIPFLSKFFDKTEVILDSIDKIRPDLIGFSVVTNTYPWAINLAKTIKSNYDIPIVFGGAHPTAVPDVVLNEDCVDYLVRGESENAIQELVRALENKGDLYQIKNLSFKDGKKQVQNSIGTLIEDLDSIPFPEKGLFHQYIDVGLSYKIMTSRGCPFNCSFCCNGILLDLYKDNGCFVRRRSVDNVISELELAKAQYNIKTVEIVDDIFTLNSQWLKEFSQKYKEKISIPFKCLAHPKFLDKERATLLKDSGCCRVQIGVESLNENLRKTALNRHETNQDIINALEVCLQSKLNCVIDHIIGIPGETEKDHIFATDIYNKYRKVIVKVKCFYLTYYPGTAIISWGLKNNAITESDINNMNKGLCHNTYLPDDINKKDANYYKTLRSFEVFYKLLPILPSGFCNFILKNNRYRVFQDIPRIFIYFLELIVAVKNSDYAMIPYFKHYIRSIFCSFKRKK